MLHVAQIGFHLDPEGRPPERLLEDWWSLVDTAEMVSRCGPRVTVIQACRRAARFERNGVSYRFVAPERGASTIRDAQTFRQIVRESHPDVFHVHGLDFPRDAAALARLAPGSPVLLQDHASRVPRLWRRRVFRRGLAAAAGLSFCSLEQAWPFVEGGLVSARTAVFEIAECSSRFSPGDRAEARRRSGLYGDPAVLWVGNLDENKDPLTVLDGVSEACADLPGLELWCCFRAAPLLRKVRERIAHDPRLEGRVHLIGAVAHERIETLMRAADLFVSGSHREGSGYALIEALACGLPPVVTSIPSFAMLTHGGAVGALWRAGEAVELRGGLLSAAAARQPAVRAAVRAHFDRELSHAAIGRRWVAAYERLLSHRPQAARHGDIVTGAA